MRRSLITFVFVLLLTGPASAAVPKHTVTLSWVGDIAFSSDRGLPPGGVLGALGPIKPLLKADLVTGNLEGTLTSGGASKCGHRHADCYAFRAPATYANALASVGFDALNQANNHARDFGDGARLETAQALRVAGIDPVGVGTSIVKRRVNGVTVAFLGFSSYPWSASLLNLPAAEQLVRSAAAQSDLVVVMFHGGAEGADRTHVPYGTETDFGENRGNLRAFAHAVIDAGAGIVLGSGPHVIRGVERYRNRLIAYSLGNFAGPHTLGANGVTGLSAILRVELTKHGTVLGGRWIPLALVAPGVPRPDPAKRSLTLVKSLSISDFRNRYPIFSDGSIRP